MRKKINILMMLMILMLSSLMGVACAATPLQLNWKTATIGLNESYTLRSNQKSSTAVQWDSSDDSVVTVDKNGRITGNKVGKATISASANGQKTACTVTVKKAPDTVSAQALTIEAGKTAQIKVTLPKDTASKMRTYQSANTKIAQISTSGTVTGISAGKTTATITTFNGKSVRVNITITEKQNTGKTLVVYYSDTGNTKNVAQTITQKTGADILELKPVTPYTSNDLDWTNENSRVNLEHDNESRRNVKLVSATVDNWSEYDTVFIGYPIWWGIAAWPVNEFIESNNFSEKTVIAFCTSASSDLGESSERLKELAGTGNWLEGKRFASGASVSTIETWVESLGLEK